MFTEDGIKEKKLDFGYCVYSDVLGFKDLIKSSASLSEKQMTFSNFNELFLGSLQHLTWTKKLRADKFKVKVFTDNVLFVCETGTLDNQNNGEGEFGVLIQAMCFYLLSMAGGGLFVRGGWTFGDIYVDEDMVFGTALIEAAEIEKRYRNPCVVLADSVLSLVRMHLKYYSDPKYAPQTDHLVREANGNIFVNYLWAIFGEEEIYWEMLRKHKVAVQKGLRQYSSDKHIFKKYEWLGDYHNYFCRNIRNENDFDEDYFVKFESRLGVATEFETIDKNAF